MIYLERMNFKFSIGLFQFWLFLLVGLQSFHAFSQTSWRGVTSTSWTTTSNWTGGVPSATSDVIVGDANFTGAFQPTISSAITIKSLQLGSGVKASVLNVTRNLTVNGNITIGANGTLIHTGNRNLILTGNWSNTGTYTIGTQNPHVFFNGVNQTISGTTTFHRLSINASSTTTITTSISVANQFNINGSFDPGTATNLVTLTTASFSLNANSNLYVRGATFAANFSNTPTTINRLSTIHYVSSTINQTVAVLNYGSLTISGELTKTLAGNATIQSNPGNVNVIAGILDLSTFTLTRGGGAGGNFTISNGATVKVGGTNSFPATFPTSNFGTTSTVEFNGTNQTIDNKPYGNLILSSSSGAAVKTMPTTAMTVANNFTSTVGTGTSVSFTIGTIAAATLRVNGVTTIGSSTTMNGGAGSATHNFFGNLINNGTITGNTSTIILNGTNATISGSGSFNFNNLTINGLGTTAASTAITLTGNFATTGAGTFVHNPGGTLTMSGTSKTISGVGSIFDNLTITGTVSSTSSFTLSGNLAVSGTLNATAGTIFMTGSGKTITGGTITFFGFRVSGTVTTTNNFSIRSDFSGLGTFTATAGTVTFIGTSTYAGAHDFFNVTLNGTSLQLGTFSDLGISGALTISAGTFNVTSTVPNTVDFNSAGAQIITNTNYNNLKLSGGGIKTGTTSATINNDLTISSGVTFTAGTGTTQVAGNWINNGTFNANGGTVTLTGSIEVEISGVNTFNVLTINKASSSNRVTLLNNVTGATINMTSGEIRTGANSLTITNTRTGNGVILGSIIRTHAFTTGVAYAFESSFNTVTFQSILGGSITSISMNVQSATVDGFPLDGSINRVYNFNVTKTGTYLATLRLHYEDVELNGNNESTMTLWRNVSSWVDQGKSANNTTSNYVEQTLLTDINNRWTLSNVSVFSIWKGGTSSAWEIGSNWKSGAVPASTDVIQIGVEAFTNQPILSSSVSAKAVTFGSIQPVLLTIGSGGALTIAGNLRGDWLANATHTLSIGNQSLTVNGDISLSNGSANRAIGLTLGTGTLTITGSIYASGGASITYSGAGNINLAKDFNYTGGAFVGGTGTFTYNGSHAQIVAGGITYNNLVFNKTAGVAVMSTASTINGNLTLLTGGTFRTNAAATILGDVTINSGTTLNPNGNTLTVGGNWIRSGTYISSLGTVIFNGTGNQSIAVTTFNNFVINKASGVASISGNLIIDGDLTVSSGILDLQTFTANRSVVGGTLILGAGGTMRLGGVSNFPINFNINNISSASTVEYNGVVSQNIGQIAFGNLTISNGGGLAKTLTGATGVLGNLTINNASILSSGSHTLTVQGDFLNFGTFTSGTGTVVLSGTSKNLTGSTTFNNFIVTGLYTATSGSSLTVNGDVTISGTLNTGTNALVISGDMTLSGTVLMDGTVTFTGTQLQTILFTGSFSSPSFTNTIIFAGNTLPIFNSTGNATFVNVVIANTGAGGIMPSVNWTVLGTFTINSGSTFNGGSLTHTFLGTFNNNGTVISSGVLNLAPSAPLAPSTTTINLGSGSAFLSTGIVNFSGTRQISIVGTPTSFGVVTVSNVNAAGVRPAGNWTINSNLNVLSGSFFKAGTGLSHTFRDNISVTGTFDGETSSVMLVPIDTIQIASTGSLTFHNITVTGVVEAIDNFNVSGNFNHNGKFVPSASTVTFTGSTPSTIAGTQTPIPFADLVINKSASTATLGANIANLTGLSIVSGTFDDAGFSIQEDAIDKAELLVSGGTFKVKNALPVFSNGYSFGASGTVDYSGTNQTVALQAYGNLVLSNSGTKTFATGITSANDLTIFPSVNMLLPNASTLQLSGHWTNNGAFNQNLNTIEFNGTSTQTVSGATLTTFYNINITNTSTPGVTVESNQNIRNILSLGANARFDPDGSSNSSVFTMLSSADAPTVDASIGILPTGAQVNGSITVERYMTIEGANNTRIYRYISSPVQNATVADIQNEIPITGSFTGSSTCAGCVSSSASMFRYNESVITGDLNSGYVRFPTSINTETLQVGVGYAMFVRGDLLGSTLWNVRGTVNVGNVSALLLPVTYTSSGTSSNDGWNLVGNPFPATIDWNAASGWVKNNLDATIYTRDNGTGTGQFATWNGTTGTNNGSRYVALGQGFWVKANAALPSLTLTENVKAAGIQTIFFRESSLSNIIRVTLKDSTLRDETVIHFREDASEGFDTQADAIKLMNGTFNLSSQLGDHQKLAINSLPLFACSKIVPLAIETIQAGSYQFNFSEFESFPDSVSIFLTDRFNNTKIDVRLNHSYNFAVTEATSSYGLERFKIIFSYPQLNQDFTLQTNAICSDEDAQIEIVNSQPYVSYVALKDGNPISEIGIGNGSTLSITIPSNDLSEGENIIYVSSYVHSCESSLTKEVNINVAQVPQISSVISDKHCQKGQVTLHASGAPSNGYYHWYESKHSITPIDNKFGASFTTPVLHESNTYFVSAVNHLGCESPKVPVTAEIVQYANAFITAKQDTLFSNFATGNQWYLNDTLIQNSYGSFVLANESGIYKLQVTIADCITTAEYQFVITESENQSLFSAINVYPNPVLEMLVVEVPVELKDVKVSLCNVLGQSLGEVLMEVTEHGQQGRFNLKDLASGNYVLRIKTNSGSFEKKIIKQ